RDPLPVDEARGLGEGLLRADEVEDGGVRALELRWSGCRGRAELERALALLSGGVAGVDGCVGQEPQVLDPELAEPPSAEHERARVRAEPGAGPLDGAVRGQPAAAERGSLDGMEVTDRVEV